MSGECQLSFPNVWLWHHPLDVQTICENRRWYIFFECGPLTIYHYITLVQAPGRSVIRHVCSANSWSLDIVYKYHTTSPAKVLCEYMVISIAFQNGIPGHLIAKVSILNEFLQFQMLYFILFGNPVLQD